MKTIHANRWVSLIQEHCLLLGILAISAIASAAQPDGNVLLESVRKGDTTEVKKLLEAHVEVNAVDAKGRTALMIAAINERKDLVQVLLEAGADTDLKDGDGKTATALANGLSFTEISELIRQHILAGNPQLALFDAVGRNDVAAAERAVRDGADVNAKAPGCVTPLILAAQRRARAPLIKFLLDKGATVNAVDAQGQSALDCIPSVAEDIEALLRAKGGIVSARNLDEALSKAVKDCDGDMVTAMLNKGADPNNWNRFQSAYELAAAAKSGCVPAIEALLAKGANPNVAEVALSAMGNNGLSIADRTPLFYAAEENRVEAAKALLSKGAKVDARDKKGLTPLMVASSTANGADVVKLLLGAGAAVNAKTKGGATALLVAANSGGAATVKHLLDAGADIKATTDFPRNDALSWSAQAGNSPALAQLLPLPFGQASKDRALQFAAIMGVRNGRFDAVKLLLDNGADPNTKDAKGMSTMQFAAANGSDELVKLLAQAGAKERPQGYAAGTGEADPAARFKDPDPSGLEETGRPIRRDQSQLQFQVPERSRLSKEIRQTSPNAKGGRHGLLVLQCSDGTLQVVIKADFMEQQGIVVIETINEYNGKPTAATTPLKSRNHQPPTRGYHYAVQPQQPEPVD